MSAPDHRDYLQSSKYAYVWFKPADDRWCYVDETSDFVGDYPTEEEAKAAFDAYTDWLGRML